MPINQELRDLVLRSASTSELRQVAQAQGMKTLRQAGLLKVIEGVTTVEEILRVTVAEKSAREQSARAVRTPVQRGIHDVSQLIDVERLAQPGVRPIPHGRAAATSSVRAVTMITGTSGYWSLMCLRTSRPFIPGMLTSSRTRS